MIGSILGDIIGSIYEFIPTQRYDFPLFTGKAKKKEQKGRVIFLSQLPVDPTRPKPRSNYFTDDSVLTMAVFCALERCAGNYQCLEKVAAEEFVRWGEQYSKCGFGGMFKNWVSESSKNGIQPPYNSFGNGSAMRVSPVAYFAKDIDECRDLAQQTAMPTHNHPEGIKGAEATAVAVFLALTGKTKDEITKYINDNYYPLNAGLNEIKENYSFKESCQESVPQSIQSFLESKDYESSIRNAIYLGGDADTMAAIAGGIAEAYYGGVPEDIDRYLDVFLDDFSRPVVLRMKQKRDEVLKLMNVIFRL
jgi:type I restriction enzyme M protein